MLQETTVVAAARGAVDEKVTAAAGADMSKRDRLEGLALARGHACQARYSAKHAAIGTQAGSSTPRIFRSFPSEKRVN